MIESYDFFNLSGVTYAAATVALGTLNTNYYLTKFDYDSRGRQKRVETPTGTITRQLYDARNLPTQTWVGTDDTPSSGYWSPSNTTGTNLTLVQENTYDGWRRSGEDPPSLPTLSQTASGSLPARTYYVKISYTNFYGETLTSAETSMDVDAGFVLYLSAPGSPPPGVTNTNIYVSETPGDETLQGSTGATGNWQEPDTGLITGDTPPSPTHIGDGLLTATTIHPSGSTDASTDRTTLFYYDSRDRLVATKTGARLDANGADDVLNESADTQGQINYFDLDTAGHVTATSTYDGDQVPISITAGKPNKPDSSLLRGYSETFYDDWSRVYQSKTYSVDPSDGSVSTYALTAGTWYDQRGNPIKVSAPGGLVTKYLYDGVSRQIKSFTTDGGGDSSYADADDVSGDKVLEQSAVVYDGNGNVTLSTVKQRFHDATDTGELGDPSSSSGTAKARVYYAANYYDAADRLTSTVDLGTNGGPITAPAVSVAGFESPSVGTGNLQYAPTGTAWTFGGSAGVSANFSGFTSGGALAPEGSQVAFIQAFGTASQTISSWQDGTYAISFQADQRVGNSQDLRVLVDGNEVGTFTPASSSSFTTYTSSTFHVAAGSHTITFEGVDSAGGDNTAFIDAVQIQTAFPVLGQTVEIADAPTLGDIGFESPSVGFTNYQGAPTGTAWTYANGASGVSANASTFTYMADAPEGGQVAFIYGGGELEQSSSGWSAGTYSISFYAAQRYGNSQDFEVKVDGTVVDTIQPPTDQYTKYTLTFAVAAGSHTIAFQGLDTAGGGNTAMIDQVRVVRLPDASVPGRVTSFTYADDGGVRDVTDPRGIVTRSERDLLGRTTSTTEAYVDGTPSDGDDRITLYTYDGDDHVLTMTANLPSGQNDQTTEYIYGVTTGGGSGLNSNDLLKEIRYPDKSAGTAGTSSSDKKQYLYNAVGDVTQVTDQNGSVHQYAYDVTDRQTADAVTTAGSGVDSAVLRLETAYNTQGLAYLFTSYDAASSGTVVNQVQDVFNGLGQLTTEYQSHSGSVNTSTTPKVQYAYTEMAGGANHSRLKSMTYVNGRILRYEYSSGLDTSISRISFLADDSSGSVGTHLEEYSYLGLSTIIRMARPEPGTEMTYIGGSPADAGDQYVGLDRFGQIADQRWMTTSGSTDLDRFQYAYDRDGNPLYKKNTVSAGMSELYHANSATSGDDASAYDKLNRLTGFRRGTLTSSSNNGSGLDTISSGNLSTLTGFTRTWILDALGNQTSTSTDGTSTSRTHDSRNEVTGVGSNTLTFDNAGDMTQDETGKKFTFDAWNHLVGLDANADNDVTDSGDETYRYDPLGRRILGTPVGGTATDSYFDTNWQEIEQQQGGATKIQNVFGLTYVDDLVLRDRDADNSSGTGNYGKSGSGLEERLYVQHDANHNVTSIINVSGTVQQRWVYGPYGQFTVLTSGWTTTTDAYAWMRLHQGLAYLPELGMFDNRMRFYSPNLGRFAQMDPAGYVDGANDYGALRANPVNNIDPRGTWSLARWIYTGDGNADDERYNASVQGAADYYIQNAGGTHKVLRKFGGLGKATSKALEFIEGSNAHDVIMNSAGCDNASDFGQHLRAAIGNAADTSSYLPPGILDGAGEDADSNSDENANQPDLYRTGSGFNGNDPAASPITSGKDYEPDANGMVHPTRPGAIPGESDNQGMSTYDDPANLRTKGHIYKLPGDSPLPSGIARKPDGTPDNPGHHTIGPTEPMSENDFLDAMERVRRSFLPTGERKR